MRKALFIILSTLIGLSSKAEYIYQDYLTGFADISQYTDSTGFIRISNKGKEPITETFKYDTEGKTFYYTVRIAASPIKKNKFSGKKHNTNHGVVWNYIDQQNHYGLSLDKIETGYDDLTNETYLLAQIYKTENGKKTILYKEKLSKGISVEDNYNYVCLLYNGNDLKVQIGSKYFKTIHTIKDFPLISPCPIGYFVGEKTKIEIRRTLFNPQADPHTANQTQYTIEQLNNRFQITFDHKEGYWQYLDRVMDEREMKLGGKYKIAIIRAGNGYDILYIDGSQVGNQYWQPLMLKGRLDDLPFIDHYNATWYDARKTPIIDESNATFNDNILTIHLPLNNTEVRFYKHPNNNSEHK